ncbi:DinB family protein [Hymenobacter sp. HD11105]
MIRNRILWFTLVLSLISQQVLAQRNSFLTDFLERWETSREYVVAVAEAMPESDYRFKPTAEEMSFEQQLLHIAVIIDWHAFAKADGQEFTPRWDDFQAQGRSKKEMIALLNSEFARAAELVKNFDPQRLEQQGTYFKLTRTRRQFLLLMSDHVTHHRAQMLVYLRLKGITPPKYVEFQ